tara:strand:+ start:129 stop:488 length:360 start_codon:yes stop_codon:yes gene_type:complete
MSDEVLNIKVTEAELDLITLLLEQAGSMEDAAGQPAFELLHDLMEQAARSDEGNDTDDRSFSVTENDFIDHGIRAREMQKASSRAAERRNFNLKGPDRKLSKTQTHDVWAKPSNDPADW